MLADLPAVLHLLAATALPTASVRDHLEHFLVAELRGEIVGVAGLEPYGEVALLRSVAVEPRQRGSGLGHRLTEAALHAAGHLGCRTVYLLTENADRYFSRFGFRTVSRKALPGVLWASEELRGACPSHAVSMRLEL